jgi:hypothetical protein
MMGLSVGDLKRLQCGRPVQKPKMVGKRIAAATAGRNVRWRNAHLYGCIRKGRVFAHQNEIDERYKNQALAEDDFWIFRHHDAQTARGEITPLYEAVYRVGEEERWFLVQKCHLMSAYVKAKRTRADLMWSLLDDGTPYWVDRYAHRKIKQRSAKKRYEQKLK